MASRILGAFSGMTLMARWEPQKARQDGAIAR